MTDPLTHVLAGTTAALDQIGPPDDASWRFTRCWLSVSRYEHHGGDLADLDRALADFDRLPPELPGRAKLAAILVSASMRHQLLTDPDRLATARRHVEIADTDPAPLPDWRLNRAALRALFLANDARDGAPVAQLRAALAELTDHAETVGDEEPYRSLVAVALIAVRNVLSGADNDLGTAHQLPDDVADLLARTPPGSPAHGRLEVVRGMALVQAAVLRGDLAAAAAELDRFVAQLDGLPAGDPTRVAIERAISSIGPLAEMVRSGGLAAWLATPERPGTTDPTTAEHIRRLADAVRPDLPAAERALRLATLGTVETGSDDDAVLANAVRHLAEAVELTAADDPRLPFYRMSLGVARGRRWELSGDRTHLGPAIEALESARAAAGSAVHAYWTMASTPLAHLYRQSGRHEHGRRVALSGLRGHAWNVLLQSGVGDRHAAARHAAGDALDVAAWCVEDNDAAGAVTALEAGRCLIVHSALETRDVDARLRALGEERLAERWRRAVDATGTDEVPFELRRRVVGAVSGVELDEHGGMVGSLDSGAVHLLEPPTEHETRAALRAVGADALVYLVAGEKVGAAVVVPVDTAVTAARLPGLTVPALRERVERGTAAVSRWAWDAAIGPLLTGHLPPPADRPVRLVLVPVGELAVVPWHAAHRVVADGRTEYALERAVFSYTPSARLLCDNAWAAEVALTDTGLVVADPDTAGAERDLRSARVEARAIRDVFYPGARYVGRDEAGGPAEQGPGDRADLLGWLADPAGGTVAHLACHGVVRAGTDDAHTAYLVLAGNERLAAEELVRTLADTPGRDLAVAVLAACDSGTSGRGHDEAFSLATAFLASGTRSVVSAMWRVPDTQTSMLMFMFHHFLRAAAMPPADALRAAQLWMLGDDPAPEEMPRSLRGLLLRQTARDISSWAGFVHFGR